MHFWVFSYNRGVFLQNCVESIEQCVPMCTLTVFDDNSSDPETQRILANIRKKHKVMTPEAATAESKHGGLYANMQRAYESMPDGELMCFLQDDMQLVRALSAEDLQRVSLYYDAHPNSAFIKPTFLKGCNRESDCSLTRFDATSDMYFVDRMHRSAGAYYSDALIGHVSRLREKSWQFMGRESQNEAQARRYFSQMPYLKNPFAAFLPNVSAYRGKMQTWAMRKAEAISRSGFYPLSYMSAAESDAFLARNHELLPYAEDFLHLRDGNLEIPWIYYPLQNKRWLKKANSIEVKMRKLWSTK